MNNIIHLSLLTKTIIVSIIIHCITISLMPGLIADKPGEFTARDIRFFIENIIESEKSVSRDQPLLSGIGKSISNNLTDLRTDESIGKTSDMLSAGTGVLSAQLGTVRDHSEPLKTIARGVSEGFLQTYLRRDANVQKSQRINMAEAQKILKRLEKEISLKEISGQHENARLNSGRYLDVVRERIKAQYFVPDEAKREMMKGTVVIQVMVSARGEIKDIIFLEHSDFPILDMAARVTVERAAPFPNIENLVDLKELKFIVPIRY